MSLIASLTAQNAVSKLSLSSVGSTGYKHTIVLERTEVDPKFAPVYFEGSSDSGEDSYDDDSEQDGGRMNSPLRHSSTRRPHGSHHLSLVLGAKLGSGRSGVVYEVHVANAELRPHFPPLVAKIARPSQRDDFEREKFFYDHLEPLQGVVIPRCYGWFEAKATQAVPLGYWAEDKYDHDPPSASETPVNFADEDQDTRVMPPLDSLTNGFGIDPSHVNDHGGVRPRDVYANPYMEHLAWNMSVTAPNDRISVLILEKMGGHIPIGRPLSKGIRSDILSIGKNFAHYGVVVNDVRWGNILAAPQGPGTLPGVRSIHSGGVHRWRVIDLESVYFKDISRRKLASMWEDAADRVLHYLPQGRVLEPWLNHPYEWHN